MTDNDKTALTVDNLHHSFKKHQALSGVSFKVLSKSIHGFVGPNGAGKTTTLKIIATLLKPQTGVIKVFGNDVIKAFKKVRKQIGFMPDQFSMYQQMSVFEYLDFFAAAYGLKMAARNAVIKDVLALTDMESRKDDLIKGLSRGMQQRVSLAKVLVHDPDLLLLDEPASGLDPRARIELMEILHELKNLGKTVFISSHILSELADICDSVTILDRGKVKYTGGIRDLLSVSQGSESRAFKLILEDEATDTLRTLLRDLDGVISVEIEQDQKLIHLSFNPQVCDTGRVLQTAISAQAKILSFQEDMKHLNQAFMDLTDSGVRDD